MLISLKNISPITLGLTLLLAGSAASVSQAQDTKPIPESPRSESPPPSPPVEAPRSEPSAPASPPAEAPRSEPSSPSGGGNSNNDNGGSNRNNDSGTPNTDNDAGRRNNDNDNRRSSGGGGGGGGRNERDSGGGRGNDNPRPIPAVIDGGARSRGTMSGDGSGNRRDRVIETESGEIIPPGNTRGTTPGNVTPGSNPVPGTRDRVRDRDDGGDRGRNRDRNRERWRNGGGHRDRHGHRHRRGDECYQVPIYNDTVDYSSANYEDYDDSLSAYDRGYKDGLYTGANDGRRGQTYDPERSHFYKNGTGGYRSILGSKDIYQQAYRDGFLRGYREGYQNWQRHFSGGTYHP